MVLLPRAALSERSEEPALDEVHHLLILTSTKPGTMHTGGALRYVR